MYINIRRRTAHANQNDALHAFAYSTAWPPGTCQSETKWYFACSHLLACIILNIMPRQSKVMLCEHSCIHERKQAHTRCTRIQNAHIVSCTLHTRPKVILCILSLDVQNFMHNSKQTEVMLCVLSFVHVHNLMHEATAIQGDASRGIVYSRASTHAFCQCIHKVMLRLLW